MKLTAAPGLKAASLLVTRIESAIEPPKFPIAPNASASGGMLGTWLKLIAIPWANARNVPGPAKASPLTPA